MELRLVGGERDVIAQLPQELALGAAECVGRVPRGHQHSKHRPLLDHQRHDHLSSRNLLSRDAAETESELWRYPVGTPSSPATQRESPF